MPPDPQAIELPFRFDGRPPVTLPAAPRSSFTEQRLLIQSCDYRIPLHPDEREGCGCAAICLAGKSRYPDGRVAVECWECVGMMAIEDNRPNRLPDPSRI